MKRYLIIGNGVAGMTAALELAKRGDAEVHVYSNEPHLYYYRPHLSDYLAGTLPLERVILRPAEWYARKGIRLHLGVTVTRVVTDAHEIRVEDSTGVEYDRLLYAAGSSPFVPPIQGRDRRGVFTIRTLSDAQAVRAYADQCREAVVIGGGLLGLEAARGLQGLGLRVSVVEIQGRLMPLQLDGEGSAILTSFARRQDLSVYLENRVAAIRGDSDVTGVTLQDGVSIQAQLVIIAAGVRPSMALAERAGLEVSRGVVVDDAMRTSAQDVYAAGDAAVYQNRWWGIVPAAQAQARVAAATMAGGIARYSDMPPVTALKVMGIDVTSMGETEPDGENVVVLRRADADAFSYTKLLLRDARLIGAIVIGDRALAKQLGGLLAGGASLDPAAARGLLGGAPQAAS